VEANVYINPTTKTRCVCETKMPPAGAILTHDLFLDPTPGDNLLLGCASFTNTSMLTLVNINLSISLENKMFIKLEYYIYMSYFSTPPLGGMSYHLDVVHPEIH